MQVVALDEALHPDALHHEGVEVGDPLGVRDGVLRDHPTYGDPTMDSHVEQCCVKHGAAYVVEVDVDALWEVAASFSRSRGTRMVWVSSNLQPMCNDESVKLSATSVKCTWYKMLKCSSISSRTSQVHGIKC